MNRCYPIARRTLFGFLLLLATTLTSRGDLKEFRIGYQKAAGTLALLRASGSLEKRLQPEGVRVTWSEFTAGPQLLEGLNAGAIDFGYVGEVPPIFALAGGANFVYTAYELPTPHAEGILVGKDSPIQNLGQLKGKKIAFNKGSDVHWLVVNAIQQAGLKYSDIQPVFLTPADARAAFQRGAVDAWAIWDPFFVAAQRQEALVLDGCDGNRESLPIFSDCTFLCGETTGDRGHRFGRNKQDR